MAKAEIAQDPQAAAKTTPAAYLPFKTFLSSIEALEHGIPKKIDRTIWRSQSGVTQSQILMGLRFLHLVDDQDQPTPMLHRLVEDKDQRQATMATLLNTAYRDLIAHDPTKMTPKMLEDMMEGYNVTGDTKRKAVTFFLRAAKYAGLPMHPLLTAQMRNVAPRRRRAPGVRQGLDATLTVTNATESDIRAANTKQVSLHSGGTVTMSVSYDPFSLSAEDRQFVFDLVDKFQAYAATHPASDEREEEAEEQE